MNFKMRFHAIGVHFKFPTYPQLPILGWQANHQKLYQKVSALDYPNNINMCIGQLWVAQKWRRQRWIVRLWNSLYIELNICMYVYMIINYSIILCLKPIQSSVLQTSWFYSSTWYFSQEQQAQTTCLVVTPTCTLIR